MGLRQGAETAAQAMAAHLIPVEIRTPANIDSAFQTLAHERVRIVIVLADPMFLHERRRRAELAIAENDLFDVLMAAFGVV